MLLGVQESTDSSMFNLQCEIAYNVSLIYQNSGNHALARMYTEKYIVIWREVGSNPGKP